MAGWANPRQVARIRDDPWRVWLWTLRTDIGEAQGNEEAQPHEWPWMRFEEGIRKESEFLHPRVRTI